MKRYHSLVILVLYAGCAGSHFFDRWSGSYGSAPLNDWVAKDGDYFPPFVVGVFASAKQFNQDLPRLADAQKELRLIEVKRLSSADNQWNESNLSWSVDGAYLGYEQIEAKDRKILVKDLRGNYTKFLHVVKHSDASFLDGLVNKTVQPYNADLRWANDSTRYAFMSNGGIGQYNIYVGAVGQNESIVTDSTTKDGYAVWNPRFNEIAFVSARTGNGDIYVLDLDSKSLQRVTDSPDVDLFPEWCKDGKGLIYSSGDSRSHSVMLVERENRKTWAKSKGLTTWAQDSLRPIVSPNGRHVAFYADSNVTLSNGTREWNLHVVPLQGARALGAQDLGRMIVARNVVVDLNTGPTWSPDSSKIFYIQNDPRNFNPIYSYDLFSGHRYQLKTGTRMNRDLLVSKIGILSFRAQVGSWDRVFIALTNQGLQIQNSAGSRSNAEQAIRYIQY